MKSETVEQYLQRGGKITVLEEADYKVMLRDQLVNDSICKTLCISRQDLYAMKRTLYTGTT